MSIKFDTRYFQADSFSVSDSKYTFRTRPLLHQLLWRQSEITVRAKAQLKGYEVCYDRTTSLPAYILFWTICMYILHV